MFKYASLAIAAAATSSSLFDEQSDFMKGFETGIMTRDRTDFEEFGCNQSSGKSGIDKIFSNVYLALNTVKPFIPDDEDLNTAYDSLLLYVDGISTLVTILDPEASKYNDDFCRGVQFGVKGTNVVVKIATLLREAKSVDHTAARIAKTKRV